jgi:branched-chain amino acid aminotransferase
MTPTARAKISSFQRMAVQSIPPAAKACGQYLSAYLAQSEVMAGGYDQALCMNHLGYVADGWAHNIFIVQAGVLITPPVAAGVLAGITRDSIMALAREAGLTVVEKNITRTDLYLAEKCFLTGTAAGVVPLRSVDDRQVGADAPGPVTSLLSSRFAEIVHGRTADHCEWREPVKP